MVKGHEQKLRDGGATGDDAAKSSPALSTKPGKVKKSEKAKKPEPDRTPEDGISFKDRRPYLAMGRPIPRDLKLAMRDRDSTLPHIITTMCMEWISETSESGISTPYAKRVILDGHGLTLAMARKCKIEGRQPESDEAAYQTPILIGAPFEASGKQRVVRWCHNLRNQHGETDLTVFYLMNCMEKTYTKKVSVDILSTDTDMLNLSLIYLNKKGSTAPQVNWRYAPNLSWVYYSENYRDNSGKWVNVNHLMSLIESASFDRMAPPGRKKAESVKKKHEEDLLAMSRDELTTRNRLHDGESKNFRSLQYRVFSFVAAIMAVKTDYTDPFKGVTHEKFITAMMRYADYIGDLVSLSPDHAYGIQLKGDAYARLLKTAYMLSKTARFRKDNDHQDEIVHPGSMSLEVVRSTTSDMANHFMTDAVLTSASQHMRYILIIYNQVGVDSKLIEPNPLNYSYRPVDPKLPLSRNNITR